MDNPSSQDNSDQNQLISKFIEEYHAVKRQNVVLQEKLEKTLNEYSIEQSKDKDNILKLTQEIKKYQKQVKDLRIENQNLEGQITSRVNEVKDLTRRLELKSILDEKNRNRDNSLFVKYLGRKPVAGDHKIVAFINHYENHREKIENERDQAIKQVQELMNQNQRQKDMSNEQQYLQQKIEDLSNNFEGLNLELNEVKQENKKHQYEKLKLIQINEQLQQQSQDLQSQNQKLKQEMIEQFNQTQRSKSPLMKQSTLTQVNKNVSQYSFSQNKENNGDCILKDQNDSNNECLIKLMQIFDAQNIEQLIYTAERVSQVILNVQRLEQFCRQVCNEILEGDYQDLELIIPTIRKMKQDHKSLLGFAKFKELIIQFLKLEPSTQDQKIFDQIVSKQELMRIFNIQEDENFTQRIQMIGIQIQDIQKFVRISRMVLELDEGMRTEACLTYILRLLEKIKNSPNDPEIIWKCQRALGVENQQQMLQKILFLQQQQQ